MPSGALQAATPAINRDAPISFRAVRRLVRAASPKRDAMSGNSLASCTRNEGVRASSSRLRQKRAGGSLASCSLMVLSVTDIAIRQRVGMDLVMSEERCAEVARVVGRLPVHREFGGLGAMVRRRVAVAVEAPLHGERRRLLYQRHIVDAAVAGDAADTVVHVRGVVDIDVV